MANKGTKNHGALLLAAETSANAPQKKIRKHTDTANFSVTCKLKSFARPLTRRSKRTLFHRVASHNPVTWPRSISWASQALYMWLARSPAAMRLCQRQGTSTSTEIAKILKKFLRTNRAAIAKTEEDGSVSFVTECCERATRALSVLVGLRCVRIFWRFVHVRSAIFI